MTDFRRSATWFELNVPDPTVGTVFIHTEKKDRPLIVNKVGDDGIIYRTDIVGAVSIWGSLDDWRDDYRRRIIKVVYAPSSDETG